MHPLTIFTPGHGDNRVLFWLLMPVKLYILFLMLLSHFFDQVFYCLRDEQGRRDYSFPVLSRRVNEWVHT